jgi:hypothetical protein
MKKHCLVGLILMLLAGSVLAEMRIWRDQLGRQYTGEFSKMIGKDVMVVSPSGEKTYLPFSNLSQGDVDYLSDILVPETEITFLKKSASKVRSKNALATDHVSIVTGLVQVQSKDKTPNDALRAEAYMVGKEKQSGKYKLISKASSGLKFAEENNYRSQFQLQGESRDYLEYNNDIRGVEYAGYVVFVLNRQNEIINYATNLPWLTKDKFEIFRQLQDWYFFSDSCTRVSTPRPAYSENRVGIF